MMTVLTKPHFSNAFQEATNKWKLVIAPTTWTTLVSTIKMTTLMNIQTTLNLKHNVNLILVQINLNLNSIHQSELATQLEDIQQGNMFTKMTSTSTTPTNWLKNINLEIITGTDISK